MGLNMQFDVFVCTMIYVVLKNLFPGRLDPVDLYGIDQGKILEFYNQTYYLLPFKMEINKWIKR